MAQKRAMVAAVAMINALGDIFAIGIEDIPPEMRQSASEDETPSMTAGGAKLQERHNGTKATGNAALGATVFDSGKFKGKGMTLAQIHAEDATYLPWVAENWKVAGMKKTVQDYLASLSQTQAAEPTPAQPAGEPAWFDWRRILCRQDDLVEDVSGNGDLTPSAKAISVLESLNLMPDYETWTKEYTFKQVIPAFTRFMAGAAQSPELPDIADPFANQ